MEFGNGSYRGKKDLLKSSPLLLKAASIQSRGIMQLCK